MNELCSLLCFLHSFGVLHIPHKASQPQAPENPELASIWLLPVLQPSLQLELMKGWRLICYLQHLRVFVLNSLLPEVLYLVLLGAPSAQPKLQSFIEDSGLSPPPPFISSLLRQADNEDRCLSRDVLSLEQSFR